jgi:hypothetical protein
MEYPSDRWRKNRFPRRPGASLVELKMNAGSEGAWRKAASGHGCRPFLARASGCASSRTGKRGNSRTLEPT